MNVPSCQKASKDPGNQSIATKPQMATSSNDTPARVAMPHMEYNRTLATWVQGPRQPPVVLQLHEQTYDLFSTPRPMAHPHSQAQSGPPTAYPEVSTQVLADTGAQMDALTLDTIDSLSFDPDTLFRVQLRASGVVPGSELDILGGIFLSVRSSDPREWRRTVCMFYVASNVSQNHLFRSSLQALDVVGHDFPRIGSASSRALRPFINSTNAPQLDHIEPQVMPFDSNPPRGYPANMLINPDLICLVTITII